jgi:DNA-binding NarL/FixJ family response regulator
MTSSATEGLRLVKSRLQEGIILDLELSRGEGTGLQFLSDLQATKLGRRPIVVVTTNIQSEVMYDRIHNMGAAFVFSKRQPGYSPRLVINTLLDLRNSLSFATKDGMRGDL